MEKRHSKKNTKNPCPPRLFFQIKIPAKLKLSASISIIYLSLLADLKFLIKAEKPSEEKLKMTELMPRLPNAIKIESVIRRN